MRKLSFGILAAALVACLAGAGELKVGDEAPSFKLQGSDGTVHDLSALKGKTVVLAWFPKAFTGGCTAQCKSLGEGGAALRKFDVVVFAASVDDAATNKKFAESLGADYPILSDPDKKVAEAYGVINPEYGMANRWTFYIGPDGKLMHIDKSVNVKTAAADVAAKLAALSVPAAKPAGSR